MIKISVIIATYNRCESLNDVLDTLLLQERTIDFDYEILVADNNSKDKTKEVIESYVPKFNGQLRYLFEPRQGKSFALNLGIKEAKGEIIAFTDDDVIVDKEWLLNIWKCFKNYNCDGIGGRILPLYPENTPKWLKDNEDILNGPIVFYDYGENIQIYNKKYILPFVGANMSFRKDCFFEYGLFRIDLGPGLDSMMGDDTDFFRRLEKAGKKLFYCGNALVWHKVDRKRASLKYIAKWNIASGKYLVKKGDKNKKFKYSFGVPRYLFRDLSITLLFLIASSFSRKNFLKYWKAFFTNLGSLLEFKKSNLCQK